MCLPGIAGLGPGIRLGHCCPHDVHWLSILGVHLLTSGGKGALQEGAVGGGTDIKMLASLGHCFNICWYRNLAPVVFKCYISNVVCSVVKRVDFQVHVVVSSTQVTSRPRDPKSK